MIKKSTLLSDENRKAVEAFEAERAKVHDETEQLSAGRRTNVEIATEIDRRIATLAEAVEQHAQTVAEALASGKHAEILPSEAGQAMLIALGPQALREKLVSLIASRERYSTLPSTIRLQELRERSDLLWRQRAAIIDGAREAAKERDDEAWQALKFTPQQRATAAPGGLV